MGCFFSGHRELPTHHIERIFNTTREQIIAAVRRDKINDFYAGGAVSFDMIASMMVLSIKRSTYNQINLHLILPTPDYGRYHWKTVQEKEYYRILIEGAATIKTVSQEYYTGVYLARNQQLIDYGSDLGIVYAEPDHQSGGTYTTIRMAQRNGTRIENIYELM